jgi:hypothetical protein
VTLLGIVFFFVLSVQRGWIGPSLRVALGAGASALVFGAGVWARRRYGDVYSTYAAVGAGIAGGYATVPASAALYDLLPAPLALVLAGAIAGVGRHDLARVALRDDRRARPDRCDPRAARRARAGRPVVAGDRVRRGRARRDDRRRAAAGVVDAPRRRGDRKRTADRGADG